MAQAMDSKEGAAVLIDPLGAPEPAAETGLNAHFGSTFAPAKENIRPSTPPSSTSKNPYRNSMDRSSPLSGNKNGTRSSIRSASNSSPRERYPDYRAEAFGDGQPSSRGRAGSHGHTPPSYHEATGAGATRPRRTSSLSQRYPGDKSAEPLNIIRRDSRKAYRSPHLSKRSLPGADMIDRLDPAIGGRAYHHEGPYDAALMSRNRDPKHAPVKALETSNEEALKATPQENIKDAIERHKPLDGVAVVPPGQPDRLGRVYRYQEGDDLMHEPSSGDPGMKRWPGEDYDREDIHGKSEPAFSLDRALRAHKIDDDGIELEDRAQIDKDYHKAKRDGTLDERDPVLIAGDDSKYVDMEIANSRDAEILNRPNRSGSLGGALKKRIGSLRHKNKGHDE